MVRWLRRAGIGIGLVIILLVLFLGLTRQGRTAVKTALFVPQVVPAIPIKPQGWFVPEPLREEVYIPVAGGRTMPADLYRLPEGGKRGAVLLFLGVNPAGRDDPRVVNLGQGLARAGFIVLIPWSETMTQLKIDTRELENLVYAFQYLRHLEYVDPERVGMGGFCVGASFVTVAAEDPRINEEVAFINFFGGYFNARDLVKQIASHTSFYDGIEEPWEPDSLTREVFTTHLIEGLDDEGEKELLRGIFLEGREAPPGAVEDLSPQGRTVYRLLSGVSLEEAEALLDQLPPRVLETLDIISPSRNLGRLKARVMIMHDREDSLVPSEESRRLADALRVRGNFRHTEFSFFQHMDPTRRVGFTTFLQEVVKLYLHLYGILFVAS